MTTPTPEAQREPPRRRVRNKTGGGRVLMLPTEIHFPSGQPVSVPAGLADRLLKEQPDVFEEA